MTSNPSPLDVIDADDTPDESGAAPPDQAGIADLFRDRHLELVRLAALLTGDLATAEDVVQEVFVRACARWRRLAEAGVALAYFRTAVLNGCRTVHRRQVVARRFRASAQALWAEPGPSAESAVVLAEDRRRVLRALSSLPRRQREALVLRFYQRLTEPEIAAAMGVSRGTVKSTLSRGIAALADRLSKEDR